MLFTGLCLSTQLASAETGKLVVRVEDAQERQVKGVEVGIEGIGGSGVTGDDGKVVFAPGNAT